MLSGPQEVLDLTGNPLSRETPQEILWDPHPPWTQLVQLVVWSWETTPGWKAEGGNPLVTLGQRLPEDPRSGDSGVIHTPGMNRGHRSMTWFPPGK